VLDAGGDRRGGRRGGCECAGLELEAASGAQAVDLAGDRRLLLRHSVVNGGLLDETETKRVLQHLADLWSYDVLLREVDSTDTVLREHAASPRRSALVA